VEQAIEGNFDHWIASHHSALALIILLDQFTRNIYRNTPRAWAGDSKALEICKKCIDSGLDKQLNPVCRAMLYMPLLHAEDGEVQKLSSELFDQLYESAKEECAGSATVLERFKKISARHAHVIQVFGRFPERNKYLGRKSTVEEAAYLAG